MLGSTGLKYSEDICHDVSALPTSTFFFFLLLLFVAAWSQSSCHNPRQYVFIPRIHAGRKLEGTECFSLNILSVGKEVWAAALPEHPLNSSWPEVDHMTTSSWKGSYLRWDCWSIKILLAKMRSNSNCVGTKHSQ